MRKGFADHPVVSMDKCRAKVKSKVLIGLQDCRSRGEIEDKKKKSFSNEGIESRLKLHFLNVPLFQRVHCVCGGDGQ